MRHLTSLIVALVAVPMLAISVNAQDGTPDLAAPTAGLCTINVNTRYRGSFDSVSHSFANAYPAKLLLPRKA